MSKCVDYEDVKMCVELAIKSGMSLEQFREHMDLWTDFVEGRRWIPCSDRPPEDLEEVNVTWVNHDPEPYYDFIKDKPFTASAVYYKGKWYWYSSTCRDLLAEYGRNPYQEIDDGIEIIAWMPLPEPYQEEKL